MDIPSEKMNEIDIKTAPIDYHALLKKYMKHIHQCANMTYLHWYIGRTYIEFSEEELKILRQIDNEVK